MKPLALMALAALAPAMIGPLPARAGSIVVALCGGGTTSVPIAPQGAPGPCCAKGCRNGASRKRIDRTQ